MQIVIKLFGPQSRIIGQSQVVIECEDAAPTCGRVLAQLGEVEPRLADSLSSSRLAINCEFADANQVIHAGDELALIGMVSGG